MTKQEAQVLAARLTRIWIVDAEGLVYKPQENLFTGWLRGEVQFHCWCGFFIGTAHQTPDNVLIAPRHGYGGLNYFEGKIHDEDGERGGLFVAQYLPFFRRGCWLSGCFIEASAHEKAEWIRGFSRQELQAWKLEI